MRKTKIVCTIGPASENPEILEQMVLMGMDIARLNFSHASTEQFLRVQKLIKEFNKKHNKNVEMLLDLQGPRIRVGILPDEGVMLIKDEEVTFSTNQENKEAIFINDPYLHEDIQPGHIIFLANGDMELEVTSKEGREIKAKVIRGGKLTSRKGVNLPDTSLTTSGLTNKDVKDLQFAVENNADYIALSFVKDEKDLQKARSLVGSSPVKLMSKIEIKQAIYHLDEIIEASDMIMVARGDLGIEMPLEDIPVLQKDMIVKATKAGKQSLVATQMLLSMVENYRPTRAEISDVANAVFDDAWGVMLSEESAFGKYPVRAVEYLVKTINKVEKFKETGKVEL